MNQTLADSYYLKALNEYPWNPGQTMENLNYALSYDDGHARAHVLMGRLCMEVIKDYQEAEYHFEQALMADLDYVETYKWFSLLKIWMGAYAEANKLIEYGMQIDGMDIATMTHRKALIAEGTGHLKGARRLYKEAICQSICSQQIHLLQEEIQRIRTKQKLYKKLLDDKDVRKIIAYMSFFFEL